MQEFLQVTYLELAAPYMYISWSPLPLPSPEETDVQAKKQSIQLKL